MATLTSANSVLVIAVASLYPVPQLIQGYAVDDAFTSPDVKPNEALMGVDGMLSAGYTPYPVEFEIMLQSDSASNLIFDNWISAMQAARETYFASGKLIYPAILAEYTFTRGVLTTCSPMAGAKKILQPRKYTITWQSATRSPYSGS